MYGNEELSRRYPPLEAVEEAEEDEQLEDELLKRGEELAGKIVANTKAFGRRKVEKREAAESSEKKPVRYVQPPGYQARLAQVRRQERPPRGGLARTTRYAINGSGSFVAVTLLLLVAEPGRVETCYGGSIHSCG